MRTREVSISRLVPDVANPRFYIDDRTTSHREAYRKIAGDDVAKFLMQAKHVADNGLNSAALMIVLASGDGDDTYVVKDGNRRLTAGRTRISCATSWRMSSGTRSASTTRAGRTN